MVPKEWDFAKRESKSSERCADAQSRCFYQEQRVKDRIQIPVVVFFLVNRFGCRIAQPHF
jgi:hypothetical protein